MEIMKSFFFRQAYFKLTAQSNTIFKKSCLTGNKIILSFN